MHNHEKSRRPSIMTDEVVESNEKAVRANLRLTLDELSALHCISTETLGDWKLVVK